MKTTHPVIIGIDKHKATHVAVAIDTQGTRLAALSVPTNPKRYLELERWSRSLGNVQAIGVEGTGSYRAGLSRSLVAQGHNAIEVKQEGRLRKSRPRRRGGKSRVVPGCVDRTMPEIAPAMKVRSDGLQQHARLPTDVRKRL